MGATLEQMVRVDKAFNEVRNVQDRAYFKLMQAGLHKTISDWYDKNKNESGDVVFDDKKAKELGELIWNTEADMLSVSYLKWTDEELKKKRSSKDPDSNQTAYETEMARHMGVDKDAYINQIKARKKLSANEIDALLTPLYQAHVNAVSSKILTSNIKDMKDADAVKEYLRKVQKDNPKALEGINVPDFYNGTQELQQSVGTIAGQAPRDYKPKIVDEYKKAA